MVTFKKFIYILILISMPLHFAGATPLPLPNINGTNTFVCNENSYLFTSDQRASYTDAYIIDLSSGKATLEKKFGTSHINATGYNVKDDYIYGFEYGNDNPDDPNNSYHVVKIDSQFNITRFNITGLPKTRFYLGDISMDGIFYLANRHQPVLNANTLQEIQRVNLNTKILLSKIQLDYPVGVDHIITSDFAFNPIDNRLYMVNSSNNQLIRINPDNGRVEELGYVGKIGNTYSVINFFDSTGNFYFYVKDSQKIYKIDISKPDNIDTKATRFNNMKGIINSGDGARCANASISTAGGVQDSTIPLTAPGCIESALLFQEDPTKVSKLNLITGESTLIQNEAIGSGSINALGYNKTDKFFWGYNESKRDGTITKIGLDNNGKWATNEFKAIGVEDGFASHIGDIDKNGNLYLKDGSNHRRVVVVNLDANSTEYLKKIKDFNLSEAFSTADWAFSPKDNLLYAVNNGDVNQIKYLYKIDPQTGKIIEKNDTNITKNRAFGASFFDANGFFYIYDNTYGEVFRIDIENTSKAILFSNANKVTRNDGAVCSDIAFRLDFGDLPENYPTLLENDGARHAYPTTAEPTIFLGTTISSEADAKNSTDANLDDHDDGVTIDDNTLQNAVLPENDSFTLKIKTKGNGYLNAWIDWNGDGDFDDTFEQIAKNINGDSGSITLNLNTPRESVSSITYARFRYSSQTDLFPSGVAKDGEVEDYRISIKKLFNGSVGRFNVERTDSYKFPINSDKRNAWYTQIVGKDFDYHVVFYNEEMTKEQNLSNVPIKIEIIDQNLSEGNNIIAPVHYDYFYENNPYPTRVLVTKPVYDSDLIETHASRNAIFRVSYPLYQDGSVMQFACANNLSRENCYKEAIKQSAGEKSVLARDNFAIRPDSYYVLLADQDNVLLNSRIENNISLAAGYEYNLTVTATKQGTDKPSVGYSKPILSSFELNTTGVSCHDTRPITQNINFTDGHFQTLHFTHNNVGNYLMKIKDDKLWTVVDQNGSILGCIKDSSERVADQEGKIGCDITIDKFDTRLLFKPYSFDLNFTTNNLPNSTHSDFIYMSELSASYHNTAIQFEGNITAKAKDGITTTNFTSGCYAYAVSIYPNADLETDRGFITPPKKMLTALYDDNISRGEVKLSRMERFNNEDFNGTQVSTIDYIGDLLTIPEDKFLNNQQGAVTLDLRYNIQKTLNQPINPIQITFHSLDVNSTLAQSEANSTSNFIPSGSKNLNHIVRNFYFAQVAPDKIIYPRILMQKTQTARTPLNVDIFCNTNNLYCRKTNIFNNTSLEGSPRKQKGWLISIHHDGINDGGVTALTAVPNNVTPPIAPITLNQGRDGTLITTVDSCPIPTTTKITITSDPTLRYFPQGKAPYYSVKCSDNNDSEWTGIGAAGNIIDAKAHLKRVGKMDW